MQAVSIRPDGLHILTKTTLRQLAAEESLRIFAEGLLSNTFTDEWLAGFGDHTLANILYLDAPQLNAFFTTLLVLDAEVHAIANDETRVFPLPGFLTYRASLPAEKFSLNTLRFPPLNPDGHYRLNRLAENHCLAVRLDIHPRLKVAGHVRIAVGSPTRRPQRLNMAEHRLDRQEVDKALIAAAIAAENEELSPPLSEWEQTSLFDSLIAVSG